MSPRYQRDFALDIADRIDGLGPISVTRFFGGVGLKSGGVQFAFVMKGSLYLRVDERTRVALEALGGAPFVYDGASGAVTVTSYSQAPASLLDDDCELTRWAAEAHRVALSAKFGPTHKRSRSKARAVSSRARPSRGAESQA